MRVWSLLSAWIVYTRGRAARTACDCRVTELLSVCSFVNRFDSINRRLLYTCLNPRAKSSRSLQLTILSECQFLLGDRAKTEHQNLLGIYQ